MEKELKAAIAQEKREREMRMQAEEELEEWKSKLHHQLKKAEDELCYERKRREEAEEEARHRLDFAREEMHMERAKRHKAEEIAQKERAMRLAAKR